MPYREKTAWLSLIAMAITFGPYFLITGMDPAPGPASANLHLLASYATAALAQVVIIGLGHLYLRLTSGAEARMAPDERDLAIMRRSISAAYYVLIGGMIVVGCVMPFSSAGWSMVNSAILTIALAETVHYGVVVSSYRMQQA